MSIVRGLPVATTKRNHQVPNVTIHKKDGKYEGNTQLEQAGVGTVATAKSSSVEAQNEVEEVGGLKSSEVDEQVEQIQARGRDVDLDGRLRVEEALHTPKV